MVLLELECDDFTKRGIATADRFCELMEQMAQST